MKIIPLSEGSFTVDKTKLFVPFVEKEHNLKDRPRGSLLVEIQPFVIITTTDTLLLDTGLGFTGADGILQIHHNLQHAGLHPSQVTKVLLSHLHKDHSGGVSKEDTVSGKRFLSFPNATYYVQKNEFDYAMNKGSSSYITRDFEILEKAGNVVFTNGNGKIGESIYYEVTAAHSRYHQVFWIRENSVSIFFGGDDAPQLQQMRHRFIAKYDYDGKKAAQLRQQWWSSGKKEKWTFLFYHDVKNPIWQFQ